MINTGRICQHDVDVGGGIDVAQVSGEEQSTSDAPGSPSAPQRSVGTAAVFISYASADKAAADSVCAALEHVGIPCWLAPRDVRPGAQYADAIVGAINETKAVVLVLSGSAVASSHVAREVERAASKHKPVISFRIDTAPLSRELEYFLSNSQWIDVAALGLPAALTKLGEAVRSHADSAVGRGPVAAPTAADRSETVPFRRWMILAMVAVLALIGYLLIDKFWLSKHVSTEQSAAVPTTAPNATTISAKSIAVLPFTDMSEKKDQEYFGDGMAEEILNQLVKVPELKVIGRTSSFQFKGKTDDLRKIGLALGAAYVVEGSVRRSGNHVRVTAQLIDTHNGVHRWSDTYDRATSDVIEVQNEIALNLVRALEIEVAPSVNLGARAPKSDEAYDSFLRGLHALDRLDEAGFNEAVAHFRHALESDPTYVPAAEGVAAALYGLVDANYVDEKAGYEQARSAAEAALKLDSNAVSAHAVLGLIHVQYDFDWPGAAREFKEALALAPHDPFVLSGATEERIAVGQWDEAIRTADAAIATDPLEANLYRLRSYAYLRLGRAAEAESGFRRAMEISPTYSWAHYFIGMALLSKNENEAALAEMQKETIREGSDAGAVVAYQALHRPKDAGRALARLQAENSSRWPFGLAVAYAALGRKTEAFAWLDRAYVARDSSLWAIKGHPFLKNLFSDPRYTALLRRMSLPE